VTGAPLDATLDLVGGWPVDNAAAAVVGPHGVIASCGNLDAPFALASISKLFCGWATLLAVEEGLVSLDTAVGQPGCTVRHLLAHAGGYPFDGPTPIARPGTRRAYSNTGIELVADVVAVAAEMPFDQYLAEGVFHPLSMSSSGLHGSPAHGVRSTVADLALFAHELLRPRLLAVATAAMFSTVQYPTLRGMLPGIGTFDPCPWGLGCEIRGDKTPHWTGTTNSPATFGHFGGAGTMMWVDPVADLAIIALTDRPFDQWATEAVTAWSRLSDAVLAVDAGV
jgi:CubicO group peptidase (beta-lactamase class C family)